MLKTVLSINAKGWGKTQFLLVNGCTNLIPYNGISTISNYSTIEWYTQNLDESQKQYAEWKSQYQKIKCLMIPFRLDALKKRKP